MRAARLRDVILGLLVTTVLVSCTATHDRHGRTHHRSPADTEKYLERLDRPERDEYQQPARVIQALALQPGMAVADLGAGSGYFTRRFVDAVTQEGVVYAVDVEQAMLDYTRVSIEKMDVPFTAKFILAEPHDPKLAPDSVDLIFVCNVYHHLEGRASYFSNLRKVLKPGGRVAVIDFYHDSRSGDVGFPRRHLVARETVMEEMSQGGYTLLREHTFLPRQYFLEFSLH
ncbi:MAG: class I SAM-dependent methyltransferase [Nitrospiraceae bacterium]